MYNKRESFVISHALLNLVNKYNTEIDEICNNNGNNICLSKADKEKFDKLCEKVNEITEIRERFDFERNIISWHKSIKRALKKMLLKKMIKWLSD